MTNISAVILTKNSEKNITKCIDSVSFADEVIIIDDFSSDKTPDLARAKNAKVYQRHLHHNFSEQRNEGISKASSEWVLFVDSDEIISGDLAEGRFQQGGAAARDGAGETGDLQVVGTADGGDNCASVR